VQKKIQKDGKMNSQPVSKTDTRAVSMPMAQNFLQKASYCFSGGVLTSFVAYRTLKATVANGWDMCPSMPESIYHFSSNICRVREYLPSLRGNLEQETLMIPFVEESLFRFGLQEMLLKQLPKAIIKRIAPSKLSSVDSKAARAARVLITTTAFSLAHAMHPGYGWPNCSLARLIHTFAFGLIISTIQETTGSPMLAMAFHGGYNASGAYLRDVLERGISSCPAAIPVQT
jgi:hypothetical protein